MSAEEPPAAAKHVAVQAERAVLSAADSGSTRQTDRPGRRYARQTTEGGGQGGEGRGERRVVEAVGEPVGKRISIIATVPAHGDLSPRARIYSLCSWSIKPY